MVSGRDWGRHLVLLPNDWFPNACWKRPWLANFEGPPVMSNGVQDEESF